jgi:hypothetical protein
VLKKLFSRNNRDRSEGRIIRKSFITAESIHTPKRKITRRKVYTTSTSFARYLKSFHIGRNTIISISKK